MYILYTLHVEVPITQFRRDIFSLMNQAAEGVELWVTHKGRRFRLVPEGKPADKLSRITPMDILATGTNFEDDSWKQEMMREWEQKWDRRLTPLAKPRPSTAKPTPRAANLAPETSESARTRKARRQA
jgi:antitoxin (DNA-binding transcriptional repressor) of toxin-antitoxin stability system